MLICYFDTVTFAVSEKYSNFLFNVLTFKFTFSYNYVFYASYKSIQDLTLPLTKVNYFPSLVSQCAFFPQTNGKCATYLDFDYKVSALFLGLQTFSRHPS